MAVESSKDIFRIHRQIWKFCGFIPAKNEKVLYWLWIFFITFGVQFYYPFHLAMGLIEARTKIEVLEILSILLVVLQCSLKFVIIWYNLDNIWLAEDIFTRMDARIQSKDERRRFRRTIRTCMLITYGIASMYTSIAMISQISALITTEKRLLYPGWFPFDWRNSTTNYWIASVYQFCAMSTQVVVTSGSDTYTTITLATLSGHTQLLAMRLSKLGTDPSKSLRQNNLELKMCILDHKNLIRLYHVLSKVLSVGMFFQILCTGINMAFSITCLAFYAENVTALLYYYSYLIGLCLQIYPSCYFGSEFEIEFKNLPYALFSCNWLDQDREFRQNLCTFSLRGLHRTEFICMGFFKINLSSFVIAVKSSYSLLSLIQRTK